jgi:hypothetical protein
MPYVSIARSRRRAARRGASLRGLGEEVQLAESLYTPGDVVGALDTINRAVTSLNADINTHARQIMTTPDGQRFFNEWIGFNAQWIAYYTANHTGYSISTQAAYAGGVLVAQIREKALAYNAFERRYHSITGREPTSTSHEYVSWSERLSRLGRTGMIWAGIGIVGLVAVGYIMSNVAKIRGASRLVMNRRRR